MCVNFDTVMFHC